MTPKFADIIRTEVEKESLAVRVIAREVFATTADLHRDYELIVLSVLHKHFHDSGAGRRCRGSAGATG